ncbi:outer membrane protein assembly factor BamB family protein [Planctomicrobium piriforme]|uniref:Outer membrane protein assembly factor BamB, contains PQQ-like beta-propeller repeat n=1 Tax=Planctomicrobium piriforme TaxID=1576369 RepID=A0A1I3BJS3_9PLAN|nr:PQQ-binding-like beta-propeller repeat protein [Planctomicrobium piriforme]SFH62169.1 Outer membrane protein assembly factor BamB, contains PQQ-like beta-propeller repeat [Planctomicrobium piriforme]
MHSMRICALHLLLITAPIHAGDWPFLSGPTFNAHADSEVLDDEWSAEGPGVLWSRPLGQGYSSFAVIGDRCVTQYQSALGQFVLCLDAGTGKLLWETRYDAPFEALGIYPGPRSTPTIAGDRVYAVSPDGLLLCLALQSGPVRWSVNVNEKFQGKGTEFGYSASPLVIEGLVVLPVGGPGASVVALSAEDGRLMWTNGDDSASYCPVMPITFEGQALLVSYLENALTIHDLTGKLLLRHVLTSGYDEHAALPVYQEPMLILSAPFKAGATAYQISRQTPEQGTQTLQLKEVWHSPQFSNDVMTSVIVDGMLVGFDLKDPQSKAHRPSRGTFRGLDLQTGEVLWSNPDIGQANAVCVNNRLLLFNDRGEVLLADVDRSGCSIRSQAEVFPKEVCWTRPVLSNGRLFVRSHEQAVCLSVGTGPAKRVNRTVKLEDIRSRPAFSLGWLLNGEREHPFMIPDGKELGRWYLAGLGCVLLPLLLVFPFVLRGAVVSERMTYGTLAAIGIVGVIGTPILNAINAEFFFTWPATLFAALQAAVAASDKASQVRGDRRIRLWARLCGIGFLCLSLAYYWVLKTLSEPMEWVFLFGILPAAPIAVATARLWRRTGAVGWMTLLVLGYSVLFWSAAGYELLRHGWR